MLSREFGSRSPDVKEQQEEMAIVSQCIARGPIAAVLLILLGPAGEPQPKLQTPTRMPGRIRHCPNPGGKPEHGAFVALQLRRLPR